MIIVIIAIVAVGAIASIMWRRHTDHVQDRINTARAHGFAEGQDYGSAEAKVRVQNTFIYRDWIDGSLAQIELHANNL